MDQSSSAGSSRPTSCLPVPTDVEMAQTAKEDRRSTSGAQDHQTPSETQPDGHSSPGEQPAAEHSTANPDPARPGQPPSAKTDSSRQAQRSSTEPDPLNLDALGPGHIISGEPSLQLDQRPDFTQDPPYPPQNQENKNPVPASEDHQNQPPAPLPVDLQSQDLSLQNQDPHPPEDRRSQDPLLPNNNTKQYQVSVLPLEDLQKDVSSAPENLQHQDPHSPVDVPSQDLPLPKDQQSQVPPPSPSEDLQNQHPSPSEDLENQRPPLSKDQQNQDLPPIEDKQNPDPGSAPEFQPNQGHGHASDLKKQQPPLEDQQDHSPQVSSVMDHPNISTTSTVPPLTTVAFCDHELPSVIVSSPDEPKLCGFLQKQGGPLRAWKQRWFTYEEKKNQLFYYRSPQDVMPLGHVDLSSATFTYPLKEESGTFHIKTSERTFVLKAVTQELMLYWLQQLQVKRWQHRQTVSRSALTPAANNNTNAGDDFLPTLKSPVGLVGEGAANATSPRGPLTNMSIKHPFIELQNSVHFFRKRPSQELSQSIFHVETPGSPNAANASTAVPGSPVESLLPAVSLTDTADGRTSPSLNESRNRKTRSSSSSTIPLFRRDTLSSSSDRMSRIQQEKQMLIEEVKAQKELVWILHKALEASQLEKRTCAEFLAEESEQKRLELLRHRERKTADLQRQLEEANMEAERVKMISAQRETQLTELQDLNRLLTEKNNAKHQMIIKLSDQVTSCLANPPQLSSGALDSEAIKHLQEENENLKDDIEAYKIQNKFLNSEIYQLTKLWRKSSEQEKSLMVKCAYLEASNCQVESRYLGVLKRLQETKSLDPTQRQAVQKMIDDALKGEKKSVLKMTTNRDHDEYGFKIVPDYEVEDMKLLAKIQALEIRSHNLLQQDIVERPVLTRWAQYLAGRLNDDLCPSPEIKSLLRSGVPREYRQRVWRWVVQTRTRTIRERHPQHYQQLCEKSQTCHSPAFRQIQLDLHRTLTTNQHFSSPSSPVLQQLRRVLLAFSWHNPGIGYCQGLNRLAAIALLILQNEEESFWCLVAVIESIMPQDYYTKNLLSSQADQRVLKDFLVDKLPRLASHFDEYSIDVSLVTFNWFLVAFVENLPSDILLPLWDAFLYEGSKVMFRYALALFKYKENDILKIHDSVEIHQYLRFFTKTISDGRKLISIAFNDMNPFPRRLLRNRRALHLERLQGELRELEEQQREFVTESAERKDKDLDTMVSEDDDDL